MVLFSYAVLCTWTHLKTETTTTIRIQNILKHSLWHPYSFLLCVCLCWWLKRKKEKKAHQIQAFLSVQFSSVKDIYIVKQISGTPSSCSTESLYPLNNDFSLPSPSSPLNNDFSLPSPSSPWQPPFYFLDLWIWLFQTHHLNGIIAVFVLLWLTYFT